MTMQFVFSLAIIYVAAIQITQSCDPDELRVCTAHYQPVCATFTKTFPNHCVLESELCRLAQQGFEYTETVSDGDCCLRACGYNYDPVCGSDGVSYPNYCSLQAARCQNWDWISVTDDSNCDQLPVLS